MVRHWTMRFEAKHSYFKQLARSLGNFINLPYSLASRHQQYQCYLNVDSHSFTNSVDSIQVGPGTFHIVLQVNTLKHKVLLSSVKALILCSCCYRFCCLLR